MLRRGSHQCGVVVCGANIWHGSGRFRSRLEAKRVPDGGRKSGGSGPLSPPCWDKVLGKEPKLAGVGVICAFMVYGGGVRYYCRDKKLVRKNPKKASIPNCQTNKRIDTHNGIVNKNRSLEKITFDKDTRRQYHLILKFKDCLFTPTRERGLAISNPNISRHQDINTAK